MATAGELGRLPPEIRKEIYAYLLVEAKASPSKRRRQVRVASKLIKHDEIALTCRGTFLKSSIGLLRVNKAINEEAAGVLYGGNEFEFGNTGVLHQFLQEIGNKKRFLRHVSISESGLVYQNSWEAMKLSAEMLASAKGLRSLRIWHHDLWQEHQPVSNVKDLVQCCNSLLRALQDEFGELGLDASVLDVINIVISPCHWPHLPSFTEAEPVRLLFNTRGRIVRLVYSECPCPKAEDVRNMLMQELRGEIAKQLGLTLD
jgi:hypothetical protein